MDYEAHIAAFERELDAFATAVDAGPLDADVPTCPDFDVEALATHVGGLLGFWSHVLAEGAGRPKPDVHEVPTAAGRGPWLRELGTLVVAELRADTATSPAWSWYEPDQTAGFWARRAAHELAVHRVDAQSARDGIEPIDAALAVDGIDELLLLASLRDEVPTDGRTIHLHGTDRDDAEWLVTFTSDGLQVERTHAKGDLALRGAVSDLELLLYQRPIAGDVERFGDTTLLDAFHDAFTF